MRAGRRCVRRRRRPTAPRVSRTRRPTARRSSARPVLDEVQGVVRWARAARAGSVRDVLGPGERGEYDFGNRCTLRESRTQRLPVRPAPARATGGRPAWPSAPGLRRGARTSRSPRHRAEWLQQAVRTPRFLRVQQMVVRRTRPRRVGRATRARVTRDSTVATGAPVLSGEPDRQPRRRRNRSDRPADSSPRRRARSPHSRRTAAGSRRCRRSAAPSVHARVQNAASSSAGCRRKSSATSGILGQAPPPRTSSSPSRQAARTRLERRSVAVARGRTAPSYRPSMSIGVAPDGRPHAQLCPSRRAPPCFGRRAHRWRA